MFRLCSLSRCRWRHALEYPARCRRRKPLHRCPRSGPMRIRRPAPGRARPASTRRSATQTIASKPGPLCVPAFGGFGGTIQLPAAKPSMTATATSSTTNYNQTLPSLAKKGKPLFYLQVVTSGPAVFGKRMKSAGGFDGKSLKPGHTYIGPTAKPSLPASLGFLCRSRRALRKRVPASTAARSLGSAACSLVKTSTRRP